MRLFFVLVCIHLFMNCYFLKFVALCMVIVFIILATAFAMEVCMEISHGAYPGHRQLAVTSSALCPLPPVHRSHNTTNEPKQRRTMQRRQNASRQRIYVMIIAPKHQCSNASHTIKTLRTNASRAVKTQCANATLAAKGTMCQRTNATRKQSIAHKLANASHASIKIRRTNIAEATQQHRAVARMQQTDHNKTKHNSKKISADHATEELQIVVRHQLHVRLHHHLAKKTNNTRRFYKAERTSEPQQDRGTSTRSRSALILSYCSNSA